MISKSSMLKLGLSISLVLTLGSLTIAQNIIAVDTTKYQTIRLDPENAIGGNASDIFSEVTFIPLETTSESLFGSISQLEITDEYYIILDRSTNSILIFTKAGKFHSKIKGRSLDSQYRIWQFSYNKWTKYLTYSKDNYNSF